MLYLNHKEVRMNGNEFLKKLKKYCKARKIELELLQEKGKGSHGTIILSNGGRTTIKDRKKEIGRSLKDEMLKQLKIKKEEF